VEDILTLFLGFVTAGLIGWLSTLLVGFWNLNTKNEKQKPAKLSKSDPELAPKFCKENGVESNNWITLGSILLEGCWRVAWLILFQLTLLGSLGGIIFVLQRELLPYFYVGVICSLVLGFHLQKIRFTWKKIIQLYKIFVNQIKKEIESIKLWFNELQNKLQQLEISKNGSLEDIYASFPERHQKVSEVKKLIVT
jgi:hypothetical protein